MSATAVVSIVSAVLFSFLQSGEIASAISSKNLSSRQSSVITKVANALIKDDALMSKLANKDEAQVQGALTNAMNSDPQVANLLNEATRAFQQKSEKLKTEIADKNTKLSQEQNKATFANTQTIGLKFGQGKEKSRAEGQFDSISQNVDALTKERDDLVKEYKDHVNKGISATAIRSGIDQNIKGGTK